MVISWSFSQGCLGELTVLVNCTTVELAVKHRDFWANLVLSKKFAKYHVNRTDSAKSALHSGFVHPFNIVIDAMISEWRSFTVHFDKTTGQQLYFPRLKWIYIRIQPAIPLLWWKGLFLLYLFSLSQK